MHLERVWVWLTYGHHILPRINVFVFQLQVLCRIALAFVQNRSTSVPTISFSVLAFFSRFAAKEARFDLKGVPCNLRNSRRNSLQLNEALEISTKHSHWYRSNGQNNFVFLNAGALCWEQFRYYRHFYDDLISENQFFFEKNFTSLEYLVLAHACCLLKLKSFIITAIAFNPLFIIFDWLSSTN